MKRFLVPVLVLGSLLLPAARALELENDPCQGSTTPEIEACLKHRVEEAQATLDRYLAEARKMCESENKDLTALNEAQKAWRAFLEADCKAVYQHWSDGTIRGAQFLSCQLSHTAARTCDLWFAYLDQMATKLERPRCPKFD